MQKAQMMYEGKAKKVYATDDDRYVIVSYKDDATASTARKRARLWEKALSIIKCPTICADAGEKRRED